MFYIRRKAIKISCEQEVLDLGLHVCAAHLSKLAIRKNSPKVRQKKKEIVAFIRDNLPADVLASHEYVAGHKELYERVGAGADGIVPSYQTLIETVHKNGSLPRINTLVDLYNCVSASRLITIGAHDLACITGQLRIGITTGNERFVPLFSTDQQSVRPGEYAYMDDSDILCRLDIRQCHKTRITIGTREAVLFANSNPRVKKDVLVATVQEVCDLARDLLAAEARIVRIF